MPAYRANATTIKADASGHSAVASKQKRSPEKRAERAAQRIATRVRKRAEAQKVRAALSATTGVLEILYLLLRASMQIGGRALLDIVLQGHKTVHGRFAEYLRRKQIVSLAKKLDFVMPTGAQEAGGTPVRDRNLDFLLSANGGRLRLQRRRLWLAWCVDECVGRNRVCGYYDIHAIANISYATAHADLYEGRNWIDLIVTGADEAMLRKVANGQQVREPEERLVLLGDFIPATNNVYFEPEDQHHSGGPHGISKKSFERQVGKSLTLQ